MQFVCALESRRDTPGLRGSNNIGEKRHFREQTRFGKRAEIKRLSLTSDAPSQPIAIYPLSVRAQNRILSILSQFGIQPFCGLAELNGTKFALNIINNTTVTYLVVLLLAGQLRGAHANPINDRAEIIGFQAASTRGIYFLLATLCLLPIVALKIRRCM